MNATAPDVAMPGPRAASPVPLSLSAARARSLAIPFASTPAAGTAGAGETPLAPATGTGLATPRRAAVIGATSRPTNFTAPAHPGAPA